MTNSLCLSAMCCVTTYRGVVAEQGVPFGDQRLDSLMNGFQGVIVFAGAEKRHCCWYVDDDLTLWRVVLGRIASPNVEEVVADRIYSAANERCILNNRQKMRGDRVSVSRKIKAVECFVTCWMHRRVPVATTKQSLRQFCF